MSRDNYEEFPELTPQAQAATRAGRLAASFPETPPTKEVRRYLSAFLLEAMNQTDDWEELEAIANNLHSPPPPPPPPPTLAQARAADLDTPKGKAAVSAFLATLVEGRSHDHKKRAADPVQR